MEIQKIYSDPYDEERLYSVLMGEDEIRMFTGAVKRANKILKNKWVQEQGEKVLMDRGLKKYESVGGKTILNPEFSDLKFLGRKNTKLTVMRPQDVKDIHSRITAKGKAFQFNLGTKNKETVTQLRDPQMFYSHDNKLLNNYILVPEKVNKRRISAKDRFMLDHPAFSTNNFSGKIYDKAVSEFYPKKPWYKSWKKTNRKDLYNLEPNRTSI